MVEKKWAFFGAAIVVTIIGFIAANKYWFYPAFTSQIDHPPVFTSPADNPNIAVIKPFAETLNKIIQEPDVANISGTTEIERNPFLWLGELTPPAPQKTAKKVQPVEIPKVGMIIIGENSKTAMLDNSMVHPGDTYGGHFVESIFSESIILSGEYGVLKISMPSVSFGAPTVDILEEKNPNLLIEPVFVDKTGRQTRR